MREDILNRLRKMKKDISVGDDDTFKKFLDQSEKDREEIARYMYYSEKSPVMVTPDEYSPNKGTMDKIMLDVVSGFDRFLDTIRDECDLEYNRKRDAATLLKTIMILPAPYCQILYLRYYKCLNWKETSIIVHMSRTTFFRNHEKAVEMLEEFYDKGRHT